MSEAIGMIETKGYTGNVEATDKLEIRKAVKAVYGVTPTDVRVMRIFGKPVRSRSGMSRRSTWRKAIVTLKQGDRIDQFANA